MKQQRGQIVPVTLFGVAATVLTVLAVFSTSQLSSVKQILNNATDAAAHFGAVLPLRSVISITAAIER